MPMTSLFRFLALAAAVVVAGPTGGLADQTVDLELVLAVDVSGSVDPEVARLQRQGYVQAFLNPRIMAAIKAGYEGRIAAAYFEWAGFDYTRMVVDWSVIEDADGARAFAGALASRPIAIAQIGGDVNPIGNENVANGVAATSISQAIRFAQSLFKGNGFRSRRRVIDISGDGANNDGRLVTLARDEAVADGITINGLPIVNGRPGRFGRPPMPDLDLYYRDCVIGGRSAFMVVADTVADFARAVRRKLIIEIAGRGPARLSSPVHRVSGHGTPPCDAGERRGLIDGS